MPLSLSASGQTYLNRHRVVDVAPGRDLCRQLAYNVCAYQFASSHELQLHPVSNEHSSAVETVWWKGDNMYVRVECCPSLNVSWKSDIVRVGIAGRLLPLPALGLVTGCSCDVGNNICACDWDGGDCCGAHQYQNCPAYSNALALSGVEMPDTGTASCCRQPGFGQRDSGSKKSARQRIIGLLHSMLGYQSAGSFQEDAANSLSENRLEACAVTAMCGAPIAPQKSTYAHWRNLAAFQQALYLIDETEAQWQRLKHIYANVARHANTTGGEVESRQEARADSNRRSNSSAGLPAVEFYSLNWGADAAPAVNAFAEFLGGKAVQYDAFTRQHASNTVKETFAQGDAEALDMAYRTWLRSGTAGTAPLEYVESVRTLVGMFAARCCMHCLCETVFDLRPRMHCS